ncbi:MAG: M48 metallopeptidase family protein [Thermodesulfobacteriota bacterium]
MGWPKRKTVPVEVFNVEVRAWARRIGVEPTEIRIRPMRRKWASCSFKGRLTFDTELLHQPAAFRTEVIVHELLHLKVPNHGKLFRALLCSYSAEVRRETLMQVEEARLITAWRGKRSKYLGR